MKLPEFSVNRRVTTIMLALILVVLGMISTPLPLLWSR